MPGEWHETSTNARLSAVSSPHIFKQRQQIGVDLPRLALGAVAVARRIEDHGVVAVAALQFAAAEFHRVFGDPANRPLGEAGEGGVLPRPVDDVLRRVDVHDLRPRGRGGQRAAARVRKQIQNPAAAAQAPLAA